MDTLVKFEFDSTGFFPVGYTGTRSVKLINPPVIPATGDPEHIRIEEFFEDADLIRNFEDQSEGQVYYAERLNTIIGKDRIEVVVVLYSEATFKKFFPQFFSGALVS